MAFSNEDELDIEKELNSFVGESVREVALSFLTYVTFASPVDTGRFAANWTVGINLPDDSSSTSTDISRNESAQKREIEGAQVNAGTVIWISNNLPYAQRLNNGYSQQAPKFFVEKAARRAGININDGEL